MRSFYVLCALAVATANPQGYNYQQPNSHQHHHQSTFGASSTSSIEHNPSSHQNVNGHVQSVSQHNQFAQNTQKPQSFGENHNQFATHSQQEQTFGGNQNQFGQHSQNAQSFGGIYSHLAENSQQTQFGSSTNNGHGHSSNSQQDVQAHGHSSNTIVTKNFYIHSAPEEDEEDLHDQSLNAGPARKHYKVLFIKAPSQSSKAAAQQLAQAQSEDKTVIYVLSKKTDASELQSHIQSSGTPTNKPEVFFIKYKTPEEARHAQSQIQAQYDALGGTSDISDEGIAPVQSFIGALDNSEHNTAADNAGSAGRNTAIHSGADPEHSFESNSVYLPPPY